MPYAAVDRLDEWDLEKHGECAGLRLAVMVSRSEIVGRDTLASK